GGQADVDDDDVEGIAVDLEQQLRGAPALGDDLEPAVVQETCEPLPKEDAVLGDRYAHGISALTRVPPPSGVQTRRRPLRSSSRLRSSDRAMSRCCAPS